MFISCDYTFVRKLRKSMISEIFLTKEQIEEISIHIVGRKLKEKIVKVCEGKSICSRSTVFSALDPEKYDGGNAIHRLVANEAVKYLKEMFDVTFPWAEIEETPLVEA